MATPIKIPALEELEEPRYGINTIDSPKKLLQHFSEVLTNAFPGISVKPRNGITETIHDVSAIGYGSEHVLLYPEMVNIVKDDKLYVIAWHHNYSTRTLHGIEIWNVTDGTRSAFDLGSFSGADVHVSFKRLYGAVYMAIESEFSSNSTSQYRTISKILEYIDGGWVVREIGINIAPTIQNVYAVNAEDYGLWDARSHYAGCVWNNEIWLVGGVNADGTLNSVIHSSNGSSWTTEVVTCYEELYDDEAEELVYDDGGSVMVNESVMSTRYGWKIIPFDDKLFLIGGSDASACHNDIWYTEDGSTWYQYGIDPDFDARKDFGLCEYDGYLWIIGGKDFSDTPMSDVWRSSDGFTWTEVSQVSGFTARGGHVTMVYSGSMWIHGGAGTNIYSSTDGATWTEVAVDAGLGTRSYHGGLVYNAKMWIIGGLETATPKNDVYSSTDGITWTLVQGTADFTARYYIDVYNFLNDMYVVGGYNGTTYEGNVYHSTDGVTWTILSTGLDTGYYYNYTWTFVRRTDSYAKLESIDDFTFEAWETTLGSTFVGVDETLLTGTISLSGTDLTGVGTLFDSEISVGSHIRIDGVSRYITVVSIADDTNAVVTNTASDAFAAKQYSLLPSAGDYITTDEYLPGECEGVENGDYRRVVYTATITDYCRIFITVPASAAAIAKGATHVRIYRTLQAESQTIAQGLSLRYRTDVALSSQKVFRDSMSDNILAGVTNSIEVVGMSAPPSGRYIAWHNGRLWIGGNENTPGYWYASNAPSNTQYPQKYASLFDLENDYITTDPDDNQKDTGCFEFLGDMYFCKERKIFVLARGSLDNIVDTVSHSIGVAFPNSIAFGTDTITGKPAVFFLSESGPAVLTSGGKVRLLHEFRVKELWPGKPGTVSTIFRTGAGVTTTWYSRNKVSGSWFRDTYWINYGDSQDTSNQFTTHKSFGLHYSDDGQSFGGFKYEYARPTDIDSTIYEPIILVPISNIEAYAFSHKYDADNNAVYRVVKYSDSNTFIDIFDEGNAAIITSWKPRPFSIDLGNYYNMMIARKIINKIVFDDTDGLVFTIFGAETRNENSTTYVQVRQSGLISTGSNAYRETEVVGLKQEIRGTRFSVLTVKTIPSDGDVEIHCPIVEIEPITEDYEFGCAGGDIDEPTYVIKSDAVPEESAY